jgi:glycosyltransferase involved in cell wall biosynthesis
VITHNPGIHQIVAGFVDGDAISNLALRLQAVFRAWGYESEIFCPPRHISPKMRGLARSIEEHPTHSRAGNIVVFHFSIGSETIGYFRSLPDTKVLVYHNITPGRYYRAIYDEREILLNQGREELRRLATVPDLTLADSSFNAGELEEAGYENVKVMPIILDLHRLDATPDQGIVNRYRDDVKNILFVGRVVPNKRFEDIIQSFYAYRLSTRRQARLFLVGSYIGLERYLAFLRNLCRELKLEDVLFTGHVRNDQLVAYYRVADLFLCMSGHEGFCIPLLESMRFRIPILAYAAGAVPETLGGSGVIVNEKDYLKIAEMMDMMLYDEGLRARVIEKQCERLKNFDNASLEEKLKGYLKPWLSR